MIIGIGGSGPGSGKDTVAKILKQEAKKDHYRVKIYGFGELIREQIAYGLAVGSNLKYREVLAWMTDRSTKESSRLLQQTWPEVLRAITGNNNCIIDSWKSWAVKELKKAEDNKEKLLIINPSIRRISELSMIQEDFKGTAIYVEREISETMTNHEVESAVKSWAFTLTIKNYGTLDELKKYTRSTWESVKDIVG